MFPTGPARAIGVLFRARDHVVDGVDHGLIREIDAAAFRWHEPRVALEAFDPVLVECRLALRDSWTPCCGIAKFRRTGNAGPVARDARHVVDLFARKICSRCRGRLTASRLRRKRRIVLASDGDLRDGRNAVGDGGFHGGIRKDVLLLRIGGDDLGENVESDRNCDEHAENQHERVEEFLVVLSAHIGSKQVQRSRARKYSRRSGTNKLGQVWEPPLRERWRAISR